jgi:SAM-dependent methyltransferase
MVAEITDKRLLRSRLTRAHRRGEARSGFLVEHAAADLVERLSAIERRFDIAVAHGGQTQALAEALLASGKVGRVFRLEQTQAAFGPGATGFVGDEEALPLALESIDLFISTLVLQWTNDLPGALFQIRAALKPDGLLLAAMTGGRTLAELREALAAAESEVRGGASPRVLPAADVRDLGALLQRAGLALPVVDHDALTVRYDTAFDLFRDLREMGATNASPERERHPARKEMFLRAAAIYAERFSDPDGRVRATFDIVSLSGWSPHESQQKPARRGSGRVSLADAFAPTKRQR